MMARLTDHTGALLGGVDTSFARLFSVLVPASDSKTASLLAPPAVPLPPEYAPGDIVFALECSYGSAAYLTYSFGAAPPFPAAAEARLLRDCGRLIEEPGERHFCPSCTRFYCAVHAEPAAHDCVSILRTK